MSSGLSSIFVFVFIGASSSAEPHWLFPPTDQTVREDADVTFQCQIENLDGRDVAWSRVGFKAENLFVNHHRWTDNMRYVVRNVSGGYDLSIRSVRKSDDGEYACQVRNSKLNTKVNLTVVVLPGQPVLRLVSPSTPKAGDQVTFNCSSSGGNPAPRFRWKHGSRVLRGLTGADRWSKFGTASSVLSLNVSPKHHQAVIWCEVENSANTNLSLKASSRLQVRYAPELDVGRHNPLLLVEGDVANVICRVQAFPEAAAVWTSLGGRVLEPSSTWRWSPVSESLAGRYLCRASNSLGTRNTSLTVDVLFAPKVSIAANASSGAAVSSPVGGTTSLSVPEDSSVSLECKARANPATTGSLEWYGPDGGLIQRGSRLRLNSVGRSQGGKYRCEASNLLRPSGRQHVVKTGSVTINITVQYRPGEASIRGPEYVVVGQPAQLVCTVAELGRPAARLEWSRPGQGLLVANSQTFRIDTATLNNDGLYNCSGRNDLGRGKTASFRLLVFAPPAWSVGGQLPSRVERDENSSLRLTCSARARPAPSVSWYKDGRLLRTADERFQIVGEETQLDRLVQVTSHLHFNGRKRRMRLLQSEDEGQYACGVTSPKIHSATLFSNVSLTVRYAPVIELGPSKVGADVNAPATLVCGSRARPIAAVTWYDESTRRKVSVGSVSSTTSEQSTRSELHLARVEARDMKTYLCVASNSLGQAEWKVQLVSKTVPDAPTKLSLVSRTWQSVFLEWTPGFDGGFLQHFRLRVDGGDRLRMLRVVPDAATSYNVTGLKPHTNYTVTLYAENVLGRGTYTSVHALTEGLLIDTPSDVAFDASSRVISFKSTDENSYCARVESDSSGTWRVVQECASVGSGSAQLPSSGSHGRARVSLCLASRPDVCGPTVIAESVDQQQSDVSRETIIIVGCICGIIVVILSIILIVLCWRRHQAQKKDVDHPSVGTSSKSTNLKVRGIENRDTNYLMYENQQNINLQNGNLNNANNYIMQNGHANRPHHGFASGGENVDWNVGAHHQVNNNRTQQTSNLGSPDSEYVSMHKGKRKIDSCDGLLDPTKEGSDSGVSTPDPSKPKKVVYEVIV